MFHIKLIEENTPYYKKRYLLTCSECIKVYSNLNLFLKNAPNIIFGVIKLLKGFSLKWFYRNYLAVKRVHQKRGRKSSRSKRLRSPFIYSRCSGVVKWK